MTGSSTCREMDLTVAIPQMPVEALLLQGCCREAERADLTALSLEGLRMALPVLFHGHMMAVTAEIQRCAIQLRDLTDRSQVHIARVPIVLDYLDIILPCLSKSLRDITTYIDDKTISREIRWRKMYNNMTEEAGGLALAARFMLYNHFLALLKQLLTCHHDFDPNIFETLCNRILQLREARGIPPPPLQVSPIINHQELMLSPRLQDRNVHWAEQIFSLPLSSRTPLKHRYPSRSYGPYFPLGSVHTPPGAKILFKRSFDRDQMSITVFMNPVNNAPFLQTRTLSSNNLLPLYSLRGAHELCISREGSALQLKRWSESEKCSKLWAVLSFQTWEEMVLFHCVFLALKARNTLTISIHPSEYALSRERRLFQALIIDDDYKHSLVVYEDQQTKGIRLHAAVWEGELRSCPVWTAFVTHQSRTEKWCTSSRRDANVVRLRDVRLYVFCYKYREGNMRQNKTGDFELWFASEEGAARFKEVFLNNPTPESSEANVAIMSGKVKGKGKEVEYVQ